MAKEDAKEGKQVSDTMRGTHPTRSAAPPTSGKNRSSKKTKGLQIGGTAVPVAKSTQPKKISSTNNPQQQEIEGYNRTMRRRMQQMGTGPYASGQQNVKTLQQKRKEKIERLKQQRAARIAAVKRSLPGGKISTDTKRVYYLVGGIAIAIVAVILLFIILRVTSVLH